jgi:putative oxidoreductase
MKQIHTNPIAKIPEVISAVLILIYVYAAVNQVQHIRFLQFVLLVSLSIGNKFSFLAWVIPLLQLTVVGLLLFPKFRYWGFLSTVFLMTALGIYTTYMAKSFSRLPCPCGSLLSSIGWLSHLVLNIVLLLTALLGILHEKGWLTAVKKKHKPTLQQ